MPNQNNHQKPTKEELQAQEQAAIEEAEKLEKGEIVPEEDPEAEAIARAESEADIEPTEEELEELEEEEYREEEQAEPSEEEKEALKKKLEAEKKKSSASARENQKIYAKNRVINKALLDAEEIPEPTEEELVKEYPDWDVMSDFEKTLAKETIISKNWRKTISQAKEQATKIEKWNESVEDFIDDPKTLLDNPALEGKQEKFREFATAEANNNVPFNLLVGAFLHDQSQTKPKNKGRMFERGSSGPNDNPRPKSNKIGLDEARKLRETNYPEWKKALIEGRIESDL